MRTSQLERLTFWAKESFQRAVKAEDPEISGRRLQIAAELVPGPNLVAVANLDRKREDDYYVKIRNGSGRGWYGLIIGPPSFRPKKDQFGSLYLAHDSLG